MSKPDPFLIVVLRTELLTTSGCTELLTAPFITEVLTISLWTFPLTTSVCNVSFSYFFGKAFFSNLSWTFFIWILSTSGVTGLLENCFLIFLSNELSEVLQFPNSFWISLLSFNSSLKVGPIFIWIGCIISLIIGWITVTSLVTTCFILFWKTGWIFLLIIGWISVIITGCNSS